MWYSTDHASHTSKQWPKREREYPAYAKETLSVLIVDGLGLTFFG